MTCTRTRTIGWLTALLLTLPACTKKADPKASRTDAGGGPSKSILPARVDGRLLQELESAAEACDVNVDAGKVSCKNNPSFYPLAVVVLQGRGKEQQRPLFLIGHGPIVQGNPVKG